MIYFLDIEKNMFRSSAFYLYYDNVIPIPKVLGNDEWSMYETEGSMDVRLTDRQSAVMQSILQFLDKPGGGVFILKGYAGTGKTFLLQQLAATLQKRKTKFVLLAPTGRAAAVLRSKSDLQASTIHSHLYSFSDVDGEPEYGENVPDADQFGQMRLLFTLRQPSSESDTPHVYVVDEASMVSDEPGDVTSYAHFGSGHLLSDLLQIVGTKKVIFSGDPAQLPPVTEPNSPALDPAFFQKQGKRVDSAELDQILRQESDNDILTLATKVRALTRSQSDYKWIKMPARRLTRVTVLSEKDLMDRYLSDIDRDGMTDRIAICHQNWGCAEISRQVRRHRYGNARAPLQAGDLLMVTQNNYLVPLTNGDFVEVVEPGHILNHAGFKFQQVRVKALHNGSEYTTLLSWDVLFGDIPNLSAEQQRMLMIDFSRRMRDKRVRPKTDAYFNAMQSDPYLNSLRANFGYAVNGHKAQGGEWGHVYLFLKKSMYVMGPQGLARWWYTAITRAKSRLYVTDDWWIE